MAASKKRAGFLPVGLHLGIVLFIYAATGGLFVVAYFAMPDFSRKVLRRLEEAAGERAGATARPTPAATPKPTPMPSSFIPRKEIRTAELFNGLSFRSRLETVEGGTATAARNTPESFAVEVAVRIAVPKANSTLAELSTLNPRLPALLPGLEAMMREARVSDFYHALYKLKTDHAKEKLDQLDRMLDRHNLFDCETILELRHPVSGRKALLIQSEMDVVTDGSDSDRTTEVDSNSQFFQPFTSYKWKKRTTVANPLLVRREAKLAELTAERGKNEVGSEKRKQIDAERAELKLEIAELKVYSFLVARADPFIVLPGYMRRQSEHSYAPDIGDYAVVIHEDVIYPAIFGDVGPSHKTGEASLRLTKTINPKSSAYSRPVSDLKVTYSVFPGTADHPFGVPDYVKWRARCATLLEEIGGWTGTLHEWNDILKPTPTPPPSTATAATVAPAGVAPAPTAPSAVPAAQPFLAPEPGPQPAR